MSKIEITIERSIPSSDWSRVAEKRARAAALAQNIAWRDADVFVTLPEAGRSLSKASGYETLGANG